MDQPKGRRYRELDALRGLGACSVVLGHFTISFLNDAQIWHQSNLKIIAYCLGLVFFGGHSAVLLFFMLSGFVLSIPAVKNKPQSYPVFITRRIFRLYVPYVVALGLSVLGNLRWHGPLPFTPWANHTWYQPVHWHPVTQHLLIVGQFDPAQFNTAIWTLIISMRVSIFFPALCSMVLRTKPVVSIVAAAFTALLATWIQVHSGLNSYVLTINATGYFIIGILLARYKDRVFAWASALPTRTAAAYLFFSLLLYWYGALVFQLIWKLTTRTGDFRLLMLDWAIGPGSVMIMILAIGFKPFSRFLMSSFPQFMGRICYSVYLIHGTVLFILLHTLGTKMPPMEIFLIYVPSVLCASSLFYYAVEKPSMDFGRAITRPSPASPLTPASAH